jgi:YggT family protein
MIIQILYEIFSLLASVVSTVVIVQFILSLLLAFNVVNYSNKVVYAIWTSLNAILDPILKPIRRHMPDTGAIDFSPLVLLLGINVILIVLRNIGMAM